MNIVVMSMRWVPNAFTIARFLASPLLAWLLLTRRFQSGLLVVAAAGVTDWLDGYSARKLGVSSQTGVVLDPLADKTLLVTLFLALGAIRLVPIWMLALAIGRDLVIVLGALLLRIFRNRRRFVPSMLGKVSTFFQIVFVLLVLIRSAVPGYRWLLWLDMAALSLTAIFTAVSGLDYIQRGIIMTRLPRVSDEEYASSLGPT